MRDDSSYLVWFDESKEPVEAKILAAVASYRRKFPDYTGLVRVLVNPSEIVEVDNVLVEAGSHIQPNNYWVTTERS